MTDDPFDPDHLNDTLDMIDSERRKGIYHHDHTEFCLQRGIYISTSICTTFYSIRPMYLIFFAKTMISMHSVNDVLRKHIVCDHKNWLPLSVVLRKNQQNT